MSSKNSKMSFRFAKAFQSDESAVQIGFMYPDESQILGIKEKTKRAYVFFYRISHSHLFNELEIHTTFISLPYILIYTHLP